MTGVDGRYKQNGVNTISRDFGSMMTTKELLECGISEVEERKKKEYGSLGSCILSVPFLMLLLWQAFLEIDVIFTIGTLNFFLTRLSDGDQDLGRFIYKVN